MSEPTTASSGALRNRYLHGEMGTWQEFSDALAAVEAEARADAEERAHLSAVLARDGQQAAQRAESKVRVLTEALGDRRYRHANIDAIDPVTRNWPEPQHQRICATCRETWPCETVAVIDEVTAALSDTTRAADAEREVQATHRRWIMWVNAHGLGRYLGDAPTGSEVRPDGD